MPLQGRFAVWAAPAAGWGIWYNAAMHSELFAIGGFQLHAYGLMLAIGFVLCYVLARRLARLTGRDPGEVDTLIMVAAVCGILGARLVYVLQFWHEPQGQAGLSFAEAPMQVFQLWQGGLVYYGGFIAASLGILAYGLMRRRREPVRALLDYCVVFVPLGQAFGRVGCFFHGCCYGGRTDAPLGVCFPAGSPAWQGQVGAGLISPYAAHALPVWPTQLIEAAGCALLFGALWWVYKRRRGCLGLCCGLYAMAYGALRFVGECLRDDPRGELLFGLTFSQNVSLALLALGLGFLWFAFRESKHGTEHR